MMQQSTGIFEGTSTKESKKPPEVMQIEDEYNALTSYDIVLRRGRCGRYFAKYVQKSIFEDSDGGFGSDNEDADNIEKNTLKKRRKRYQDLEEYLNGDARASNFSGLLMRDQKYLRKNMHKVSSLSVKEYATKITKRGGASINNPESLNLENQVSTNSAAAAVVLQDYAILGGAISIDSANGLNNSNLYDFDEGIRKYVKRIFNPVLDIVHQTCPEAEPADKQLEEYKAYHQKELKTWKNEKFQSRLRGGGGAMSHNMANVSQQ